MNEDINKTIQANSADLSKFKQTKRIHSITSEIEHRSLTIGIPSKQHGFLEIIHFGSKPRHIELGEDDLVIGRAQECDIQLLLTNVSRRHARITYYNEEYHIEDLESTNGVYVNGIKVARCILRNQDQIEIGNVNIIFHEEKIRKNT